MPSGLRWTTAARLDRPVEVFHRSAGSIQITSFTVSSAVPVAMNMHDEFVFAYMGGRVQKMNGSAWHRARHKAGLPQVRVHDLEHPCGRRRRAAGVSFEDRQDLLGHGLGRITTHYSSAELANLIEAANGVCAEGSRKSPALVMLKRRAASA